MVVAPLTDNYFVRLDAGPPPAPAPLPAAVDSRRHVERVLFEPRPARHLRSRRRRVSARSWLLPLVAAALLAWFAWASQQPGGVSGTVNGFIDHVRGGVEAGSAG